MLQQHGVPRSPRALKLQVALKHVKRARYSPHGAHNWRCVATRRTRRRPRSNCRLHSNQHGTGLGLGSGWGWCRGRVGLYRGRGSRRGSGLPLRGRRGNLRTPRSSCSVGSGRTVGVLVGLWHTWLPTYECTGNIASNASIACAGHAATHFVWCGHLVVIYILHGPLNICLLYSYTAVLLPSTVLLYSVHSYSWNPEFWNNDSRICTKRVQINDQKAIWNRI